MRGLIVLLVLAQVLSVAFGFGTLCGEKKSNFVLPPRTTLPANLKIAFLGDAGSGTAQRQVLQMVKDWEAVAVIHSGDFEYENDPQLFEDNINAVLGPNYPYFASIGNHDNLAWNGHQSRLVERMERANTTGNCEGDFGVNMVCDYKGLFFVLSGVGTRGSGHEDFIDETFSSRAAIWKIVSWHKNQRLMQIGGKTNEVGWEAYDTARVHGAIVATGHEHSFCRSYMMSNYEDQVIANFNETLNLKVGESFAFVSGLAGKDIRDWNESLKNNPWWAAVGASDNNVQYGALLCTFNVGGEKRHAHCVQRDINGKVWDEFDVYSQLPETEEELKVVLATQKAKEAAKQCRSKFIEIPLTSQQADMMEDAEEGKLSCGSKIIGFQKKAMASLKFDKIPLKKGDKINEIHLQVYGATTGAKNPTFVITARKDAGEVYKCEDEQKRFQLSRRQKSFHGSHSQQVTWEEEGDDWEAQNVWVSPDLKGIIGDIVNQPNWTEGSSIVLDISGQGEQSFYSFDESPCFAPTLTIEIAPQC